MTFIKIFVVVCAFTTILSACSGSDETQTNEVSSQQASAQDSVAEEVYEEDPLSETILQELASLADLEKDIAYGENLNAVVSSISTYTPRNLQIVATCLSASRIYRKILLPRIGEDTMVADGSPSAVDADSIHDALLNLTVEYGRQLDDKKMFDAVLKTLDEEAFNYFYLPADESGNRDLNLKNWGNWYGVPMVSTCRNVTAPFLGQGVDPMGIVR
jgi:hypothetical protein